MTPGDIAWLSFSRGSRGGLILGRAGPCEPGPVGSGGWFLSMSSRCPYGSTAIGSNPQTANTYSISRYQIGVMRPLCSRRTHGLVDRYPASAVADKSIWPRMHRMPLAGLSPN